MSGNRSNSLSFAIAAFVASLVLPFANQAAWAQAGEAAWKGGKMFVPASASTTNNPCESAPGGKCAGEIKPGKHPVVLFMHGCGGPRNPAPFLGLGAVVVAPNSFAGGAKCVADAKLIAELIKVRHLEISYAVTQLKAASWADTEKLVLAGFSNGGQTTATYPGEEFKARVIIAWTCNNPRVPDQNGVRGSGPVLALLGGADEFYKKVGISGDCAAAVAKRPSSKSILIPAGTHDILEHKTVGEAVSSFIQAVLK